MKIIIIIIIVLNYSNCSGQVKDYIDSLNDSSISNCEKLKILSQKNVGIFDDVYFFISSIEKITGIYSSLTTSTEGLIYLNTHDFENDIAKWAKYLKCTWVDKKKCKTHICEMK